MQDPAAAARRYLDHLTVERGLADNTLAAYRRDLERYVAFLHIRGIDDLDAVDPRVIRGFVASISASTHGPEEEAYKATSVARTLSAVRTFHRFALREFGEMLRHQLQAKDPARFRSSTGVPALDTSAR